MKKVLSYLLVTLACISVLAQTTWKADPMHSHISFSITHLSIADVAGLFKTFEVTATTTSSDFSDAVVELSIDVASIDTEIEMRDKHLRSPDFFEVEKFPKMTFISTSIKKISKDKYKLTGNLTLHGITKPVTMDLWYRGTTENPQNKATTAGFQLTGSLKRSDFNIGPKFPAPGLSDKVSIKADGEFIKELDH
ncbi:MAG: YceI family protein [Ferruginibacter sp.]|nr:YceI family protein [Chitinophagaceae bacterium]